MSDSPRVLFVAFHFPPFSGSSGIHRSLKFAKYLPEFGWQPIVLSANPRAYTQTSQQLMHEIPDSTPVIRAQAFDAQRHFSWKGRYPDSLAVPDRFSSWVLAGIPQGLLLIKKYKPKAIWSTYPLASAHLLALALARISGLPWIADFRDPMTGHGSSPGNIKDRSYAWIEAKAMTHSKANVFVSDTARKSYVERFPNVIESKFRIIENGYDEEDFAFLNDLPKRSALSADRASTDKEIVLLHTGGIYPDANPAHRGPGELFKALGQLVRDRHPLARRVRLHFRGSGLDEMIQQLAAEHGVGEQVSTLPSIDYKLALHEMADADGLLLLQGPYFARQIPAKIYEYFRVGRPIIGLCGHESSTADLMRQGNAEFIAALTSASEIKACLASFLNNFSRMQQRISPPDFVLARSRRALTGELSSLLTKVSKASY
jgi:Glycosyl transferase 4-like domain